MTSSEDHIHVVGAFKFLNRAPGTYTSYALYPLQKLSHPQRVCVFLCVRVFDIFFFLSSPWAIGRKTRYSTPVKKFEYTKQINAMHALEFSVHTNLYKRKADVTSETMAFCWNLLTHHTHKHINLTILHKRSRDKKLNMDGGIM